MDATRTRRTKDLARRTWYAGHRQRRFARHMGFAGLPAAPFLPEHGQSAGKPVANNCSSVYGHSARKDSADSPVSSAARSMAFA